MGRIISSVIKILWGYIAKLFGGGAAAVIVALIAFIAFQQYRLSDVREDRDAYKLERDRALQDAKAKHTTIITQAVQAARQADSQKDKDNAQQIIQSVPDSQNCIDSQPIGRSIDWLRDYRDTKAADID